MLGLEYQSKRGYIGLEYYGRTVGIKIMPVGIHMGRIASVMKLADKEKKVGELKQQFEGKTVLLGVDDMDIFKGINLKLLAMEQLLQQHSKWQGKAVLVQIANPAKGKGADLEEIQAEIRESCRRINEEFGEPGYEPIVLLTDQFQSMRELPITVLLSCRFKKQRHQNSNSSNIHNNLTPVNGLPPNDTSEMEILVADSSMDGKLINDQSKTQLPQQDSSFIRKTQANLYHNVEDAIEEWREGAGVVF
ncbi:hypothetical protein VitviT2T_008707 [Vitis vinifera]|uniref:Uncharacterized protein n=1 Tax=Vitis vinifera TaxID=29760 RepID=A0ABY9C2L9_VITVI|nr:hypothetical protein VitviT2T_008707 [Vitis vinifera]